MCDFSGKLIAWLDRELAAEEATEVEKHLGGCSECRSRLDSYRRASADFDAYCDETMEMNMRPKANPWTAVTAAAGAGATLVALFFVWPRPHVQPRNFPVTHVAVAAASAVVENPVSAPLRPIERIHRQQTALPAQVHVKDVDSGRQSGQSEYFMPEEPVIQISIPAEEMFPPGAVPQGMDFVADITIAADGSPERMRLRPRLAEFERRAGQP